MVCCPWLLGDSVERFVAVAKDVALAEGRVAVGVLKGVPARSVSCVAGHWRVSGPGPGVGRFHVKRPSATGRLRRRKRSGCCRGVCSRPGVIAEAAGGPGAALIESYILGWRVSCAEREAPSQLASWPCPALPLEGVARSGSPAPARPLRLARSGSPAPARPLRLARSGPLRPRPGPSRPGRAGLFGSGQRSAEMRMSLGERMALSSARDGLR